MNRTLVVALLSILAVLAVFGRRAVSSHIVTPKPEARETVRDATPGGHETKRIQILIEQASRDVLAYGDKIGDIECHPSLATVEDGEVASAAVETRDAWG